MKTLFYKCSCTSKCDFLPKGKVMYAVQVFYLFIPEGINHLVLIIFYFLIFLLSKQHVTCITLLEALILY